MQSEKIGEKSSLKEITKRFHAHIILYILFYFLIYFYCILAITFNNNFFKKSLFFATTHILIFNCCTIKSKFFCALIYLIFWFSLNTSKKITTRNQ